MISLFPQPPTVNGGRDQVPLEMSGSHPKLGHRDRAKAKSWVELSHTKPVSLYLMESPCSHKGDKVQALDDRISHPMMTPQVEAT